MRVAFIGKGGAGKSVIAGTFCRLLARSSSGGVVAIDSDPLPGLAFSLGVASTDTALPPDLVEQVDADGGAWKLRDGTTAADAVEQHAFEGPDGVRLLQFGKLRGHVRTSAPSQQAFRVLVRELSEKTDLHLIGDLPGGTRQPFFGWGDFADVVVVVADASHASMLSARRLARLASAGHGRQRVVAVANKIDDPSDADQLARFSGLPIVGVVPRDPAIAAADRAGAPVLDQSPTSPAVQAVASLVDALTEEAR